ncbi:MAG: response regulator [Bdellovibrionales bacterium]|nr:response regulator [Bdellovibrionales bacterium]
MSRKRALVLDDQPNLRMAAKSILNMYGFDVDEGSDGKHGLELIEANRYDIVFSDVEMPNMNGFEFLARAKRNPQTQHIPIVICTTLSKPEHIEKGKKLGAVSYIVKPMQKETLDRALRNAGLA